MTVLLPLWLNSAEMDLSIEVSNSEGKVWWITGFLLLPGIYCSTLLSQYCREKRKRKTKEKQDALRRRRTRKEKVLQREQKEQLNKNMIEKEEEEEVGSDTSDQAEEEKTSYIQKKKKKKEKKVKKVKKVKVKKEVSVAGGKEEEEMVKEVELENPDPKGRRVLRTR